ncbi:MAG: hypothetical protein KAX31_04545, partial [Thermoplasmata archaeon]|nr:hypothetical protein [Thermoplasmata archaeon]
MTLWYRHSADNSTWGANQSFGLDTSTPWNWTFDFPDSEGYYEFYSIAVDNASYMEAMPVSADASCAYDSILPVITLNSPANNSVIQAGTTVNLTVDDVHLDAVNYSVNGSADLDLSPPYDIETTGWTDGEYDIEVRANDIAGNTAVSTYTFTIDSTCPVITLNSPANNS